MADGRTHARDSLLIAVPTGLAVGAVGGPLTGFIVATGCALGVIVSPDLDIEGWTYSEWVLRHVPLVGWLLSWFWFLYWWPYGKAFRHGHWLTHLPVVGTSFRFAYAFAPGMAVAAWLLPGAFWPVLPVVAYVLVHLFVGLTVADMAHWIRDGFRLWGVS